MTEGPDSPGQPPADPIPAELRGVPETLLWNLYHRSVAAAGKEYGFDDPKSVELVERIAYPFERFESSHTSYAARWHALRVQTVDAEINRFLTDHPCGTVVALGEGLETQFWRVDNGKVNWLSVDLPETLELRRRLLPEGPRIRGIACSALHGRWMDEVDQEHGVLITAQGLLMYLKLTEVDALVTRCARRFPGEGMVFDAVPARMLHAQQRWHQAPGEGYQPPEWQWGMDASVRRRMTVLPGVSELREVPQVRGRGLLFGGLLPTLRRIPGLAELLPAFPVLRAQFAG
jgi:O-methyltransferase involved in polyketide biosynthesis